MMRKQYLRILIALIGAAGLAKAAKGQSVDQIVVNIPYEFVVAGKTLPADTYRVNRVTNPVGRMLLQSWKPQRYLAASPLPRELRIKAIRLFIHAGTACGSPLCI